MGEYCDVNCCLMLLFGMFEFGLMGVVVFVFGIVVFWGGICVFEGVLIVGVLLLVVLYVCNFFVLM